MSSTVSLTIEAPEQVEAPYRWPTKRSGDPPFPHACVKTETGEIEYQLAASSRSTSLTFKFNHSNGVDVQSWGDFFLSLQVKIHETWEDIKDFFFQPFKCWGDGQRSKFGADNSIKWVIDQLHALKMPPVFTISERGDVRHEYCKQGRPVAEHGLSIDYGGSKRVRLFRFKAVGKGRIENEGQYCEAYTVPFATVYDTLSGEQARKHRLNSPQAQPRTGSHKVCNRPLTAEEEASAVEYLVDEPRDADEVICEVANFAPVSRRKILCLRPLEWLNDEVVNCFMGLLQARQDADADALLRCHFFTSQWYAKLTEGGRYEFVRVKRWTKKVDVLVKDLLIFPIHRNGNHWTLAVVNFLEKRFEYFDSMSHQDEHTGEYLAPEDGGVLANLRLYIKDEHHAAQKEAPWDDEGWTDHVWVAGKHNTPRQTNSWDCGVFMCKTADLYAQDARLDFGQDDMGYFRRRMAIEIHNKELFAQGEPGVEEPQPRAPVVCSSGKAESSDAPPPPPPLEDSEEAEDGAEAEDGKGKEKEDDGEEDEPCSVVLKRLKADSIAMLDPSRYRYSSSSRHRTQHVNSLYAEVIEIARGMEGQGVDLGVVERARLDFGGRPFNPVDNALDDSLHGYMNAAYAGVAGERAFEQRDVDDAVAVHKKRIYNNEELKQRHKAAGEKPLTVADEFTKAALAIEAAVRCAERGSYADLKTIVQSSSNVITAALSFISPPPPPSTIDSWHTFRRSAERVYDDMRVSCEKKWSLRCDARFLVGELSDDDASAMKRGAELLRTLAEHIKLEADGTPSAALPLAASPKLVDGGSGQPEPAMRTAAVAAVEQSTPPGMTLCVLPANDAIEGSCETTMYMPIALRSMPPRCILRFIAERSPLPSRPRGSKRLAERALPDALRLLETFMDDSLPSSDTSLCPFRSYGELHPDIVRKLCDNAKRAAARLRGEPEPEPEPEPQAESSHAPVTPGIELDEENSGPCVDEDGGYSVRYTFNLTLKDGRVEPWPEETEFKDITDRRRFKDVADCEEFYFDNREKAEQRAHAQLKCLNKEISRQEKTAATRKCIDKWNTIKTHLMQSARNAASKDVPPQLVALGNAAAALGSKVEMEPSYKDGDPEFYKHGSARSAHENEGRRARRTTKCKDNDEEAASASVQLDCEWDLETGQKVSHPHALAVLKGIAVKAGLRVIPLAETVRRSKVDDHDTKGTRTTRRAHLIPIMTHDELFKVADVVLKSIEIFRDPSREVDQEAWKKETSKKRKRGA